MKCRILAIFLFIKVRNYLAPNFTTEDFRIQVRRPRANYVYGCHLTPVTRGSLGYVSYQKGIIQGQLVHRYATRRAPALCSRVLTVLSLVVSTQTVFLYCMSMKYTLMGHFWCFGVHVTHWLLCQTDEINTIFQPFIGFYIWGYRWILVLLRILLMDTNIQIPILRFSSTF